jgi:hypothetical protein
VVEADLSCYGLESGLSSALADDLTDPVFQASQQWRLHTGQQLVSGQGVCVGVCHLEICPSDGAGLLLSVNQSLLCEWMLTGVRSDGSVQEVAATFPASSILPLLDGTLVSWGLLGHIHEGHLYKYVPEDTIKNAYI